MRAHAHKVWSLDLVGHIFGDESLAKLPDLARLELLELKANSISGHGLTELSRFPKLRVLRIALDRNESFRIPELATKLAALEVFDIHQPPHRPWGFSDLLEAAPALNWLTFKSHGELFVDGDCPPTTDRLGVQATRITRGLKPPKTIESVYAHLSEMNDRDVDDWLASAQQIGGLDLSGPITDAFAEALPTRFGLRYLNVVQTLVSEAAVKRIRNAHPKLKLLPNLGPSVQS